MKTVKMKRFAAALLALLMAVLCLSACGGDDDSSVTLTVRDGNTRSEVKAYTGNKIADILSAAGITLGAKDVCVPAADSELADGVTEIVVQRYAKVTVVKDGVEKEVELTGKTVKDAIEAAGFTIGEGEEPDVDPGAYLTDGMVIGFIAEKQVEITVGGRTVTFSTKAKTVEELLKEDGITLGPDDEVSEKLDAPVTDGLKLTVKRVEYKDENKIEKIAYTTKEEYSDSLPEGTSEVTRKGVEGEKEVTYKVKYVDGKEESREKTLEKVTKEPVDEIVTYGTASSGGSGDNGGSGDDGGNGGDNGGDNGVYEVSRDNYPDCDGSGHGYWEVHYSDGSTEYIEY